MHPLLLTLLHLKKGLLRQHHHTHVVTQVAIHEEVQGAQVMTRETHDVHDVADEKNVFDKNTSRKSSVSDA
jgi:hypothetical protein